MNDNKMKSNEKQQKRNQFYVFFYHVSDNFFETNHLMLFHTHNQRLLFPPEAHCFNTDITIKVAGLIKVG